MLQVRGNAAVHAKRSGPNEPIIEALVMPTQKKFYYIETRPLVFAAATDNATILVRAQFTRQI